MNVRQGRHGRYAFATLDDGKSKIEVSIWAESFELYRSALRKGQLVIVEGVVEKDDFKKGSYKIIANKVLNWEQAQNEYTSHIQIVLDPDKMKVEELTSTLKEMSELDGSPIVIKYSDGKASGDIALPKNFTMRINDASINSLKELCGSDKVKLVYHSRPNIH